MSSQSDLNNSSNQMNPNNDAYWISRGYDERPDNWKKPNTEHNKSASKQSHGHKLKH